jgi:hypothetical protein
VSGYTPAVLIVVFLAAILFLLVKIRRPTRRRSRIRILPKETVIILAGGDRPCPACGEPLREGDVLAKCNANAAHVVHKECKLMVKEKCPTCGGKLGS